MKYHNKSFSFKLSSLSSKKAFTLVELIIVITILAILATIAFVSFKGYLTNTRDSNRITTIKNIDEGLAIYQVSTGLYPKPEGDIVYSGSLDLSGSIVSYSYLGVIGDNISKQIKINPTPLDPLSNTNYIYATTINYNKYQIATVLENLDANMNLTDEVYANESSYKAKVLGTHNTTVKISTGAYTYFTTVPSMIFAGTGNILNSSGTYAVVNGGTNLPYKLSAKDTITNKDGNQVMKDLKNDDKAKIITVDITEIVNKTKTVEEVFGTGGTNESKELLSSFGGTSTKTIETMITGGNNQVTLKQATYNNCSLSGQTINHGQSITAYNETSILWNASYDCASKSLVRVCNNGVLDGSGSYIYTSCVKGVVNNCSASGSFVKNGHTYSIPAINHASSATNILSSNVSENNGTFKRTLTNIECNDGSYINATENATPTLQSCNTNYTGNGSSCVANIQKITNCTGTLPTNAVWIDQKFTQTWNGTIWFPASLTCSQGTSGEGKFNCNTNYAWNGSNACTLIIRNTLASDTSGWASLTTSCPTCIYNGYGKNLGTMTLLQCEIESAKHHATMFYPDSYQHPASGTNSWRWRVHGTYGVYSPNHPTHYETPASSSYACSLLKQTSSNITPNNGNTSYNTTLINENSPWATGTANGYTYYIFRNASPGTYYCSLFLRVNGLNMYGKGVQSMLSGLTATMNNGITDLCSHGNCGQTYGYLNSTTQTNVYGDSTSVLNDGYCYGYTIHH